jgi:hypothetical protein
MRAQKEQVSGPWGTFWKVAASISVVGLISMAFYQAAQSTSGRKALHGGMALPYASFDLGDSGDRWTAERLCRHFKVENPAQVEIAFGVNSPEHLRRMIATRAAVNIIHAEVVYSQMEDTGKHFGEKARGKKNVYAIPVMSHSPYHRSTFTFDAFLEAFMRGNKEGNGLEQGLMLTFKDPRAVIPCLKLLNKEIRYGGMLGPLIIDAEVLPGPGGFLPGMASVFRNTPRELPGSDVEDPPVPGDVEETMRQERERRTVAFHPTAFVHKVKMYVPGALLSIGWSAHGGCVDTLKAATVRKDYTAWYTGEPIPSVAAANKAAEATATAQVPPQPTARNLLPATVNPKPANLNSQPETRKPVTHNLRLATRNLQPASCNPQPVTPTPNPQPSTLSPQP